MPGWLLVLLALPVALLALAYAVTPVIVAVTFRQRTDDTVVPVDPDAPGELPEDIRAPMRAKLARLQALGFTEVGWYWHTGMVPRIQVFVAAAAMPDERITAVVATAVIPIDHGVHLQSQHIELASEHEDGREIVTTSSDALMPPGALRERLLLQITRATDPADLLAIHRLRVADIRTAGALLPVPDPAAWPASLRRSRRRQIAGMVAAGVLAAAPGGAMYRPTLAGAVILAWTMLWPISQLRRRQRDRRTAAVLAHLGWSCRPHWPGRANHARSHLMSDYRGRFAWYELMTNDVDAARAFYTEVIGWGVQSQSMEGSTEPYYMWTTPAGPPMGGLMALPEETKALGVPPNWSSYIGTPDVDAAVARVKELGGQVHVGPMDIPEVGRFAIVADPQGAAFGMLQHLEPPGTPLEQAKLGEVSWHELMTTDREAAWKFYEAMFGWKHISSMDMGEMGTYFMFGIGEHTLGGMFNMSADMPAPPHWVYYVHVDDADAAVERVKARGGQVVYGPMDVPGGDRVAQFIDPQGAVFAVHASKK